MKKSLSFFLCSFLILSQMIWVNAYAFSTTLSAIDVIEPMESFSVMISVSSMPASEAFESDLVFDKTKLTLQTVEEVNGGHSVFVGRRILIDFHEVKSGDMDLYALTFVPTESFVIGDCVTIELKNPSVSDGWLDRFGLGSSTVVCMEEKDITPPEITIVPYDTRLINQDVTVYATTNEGSLNQDSYTFTSNGSFTFMATDEAGNVSEVTVVITHIDKVNPVITLSEYSLIPTHEPITVFASVDKGTLNQESFTFVSNGSFTFVATDEAGNVSVHTVEMTHILKTYQFSVHIVGIEDAIIFDTNLAIEGKSIHLKTISSEYKIFSIKINGDILSRDTREIFDIDSDIHVEIHVVLNGDVNHDGKLTSTDLVMIRRHLAGIIDLDDIALFSGDLNNDSRISATDMVVCRRKLAGLD